MRIYTFAIVIALTGVSCFEENLGFTQADAGTAVVPDAEEEPQFTPLGMGPLYARDMVSDADTVYWVTCDQSLNTSSIHRISKEGGPAEEVMSIDSRVYRIALDETYIYIAAWSGNPDNLGYLSRVPKVGGAQEVLVPNLERVNRIAVGPDFVYFEHQVEELSPYQAIWRVPKAGGSAEAVVPRAECPCNLAIDDRWLYYTEGNFGLVMRVDRAGGTPQELTSGWVSTNEIALDSAHVYFGACPTGDCLSYELYRISKGGDDLEMLGLVPGSGGDIAVAGGMLFVAVPADGSVFAVPTSGGSPHAIVTDRAAPMSVTADEEGTRAYWVEYESGFVGRVDVGP